MMTDETSRLIVVSSDNGDGMTDPEYQSLVAMARTMERQGSSSSHASHSSGIFESVKFERDDADWVREMEGTATILNEFFNISKNLLGAGVLSMSGGIAIFADDPWAVFTGAFWIIAQGAVFAYFCVVIAKICRITGSNTIRECWESTMGPRGAVAVVVVIALNVSVVWLGNILCCRLQYMWHRITFPLSSTAHNHCSTMVYHDSNSRLKEHWPIQPFSRRHLPLFVQRWALKYQTYSLFFW